MRVIYKIHIRYQYVEISHVVHRVFKKIHLDTSMWNAASHLKRSFVSLCVPRPKSILEQFQKTRVNDIAPGVGAECTVFFRCVHMSYSAHSLFFQMICNDLYHVPHNVAKVCRWSIIVVAEFIPPFVRGIYQRRFCDYVEPAQ